ncbi:MAG: type II toxin-antitoxin system VapC family toxin [Acidobacteriia bacterium]|nr:type II toxin-antitoxin system VapC family toxin [Terriglobia bacterium]
MTYIDTSVALAHLLAEDRRPPPALWEGTLVASRLIEYEIWTRLHAYKLAESHGEAANEIIERIALVELAPPVVERALDEFPCPVRTLDALHLATFDFLWRQGQPIKLASYDQRMVDAARAMGIPVLDVQAS